MKNTREEVLNDNFYQWKWSLFKQTNKKVNLPKYVVVAGGQGNLTVQGQESSIATIVCKISAND